jgi:hypothetical protein
MRRTDHHTSPVVPGLAKPTKPAVALRAPTNGLTYHASHWLVQATLPRRCRNFRLGVHNQRSSRQSGKIKRNPEVTYCPSMRDLTKAEHTSCRVSQALAPIVRRVAVSDGPERRGVTSACIMSGPSALFVILALQG